MTTTMQQSEEVQAEVPQRRPGRAKKAAAITAGVLTVGAVAALFVVATQDSSSDPAPAAVTEAETETDAVLQDPLITRFSEQTQEPLADPLIVRFGEPEAEPIEDPLITRFGG